VAIRSGIDDLWNVAPHRRRVRHKPLAETDKTGLMAMMNTNLVSCYLSPAVPPSAMTRYGSSSILATRHAFGKGINLPTYLTSPSLPASAIATASRSFAASIPTKA
jgi:hypothetical protein